MALLGNYSVLLKLPLRHFGGLTGQGYDRAAFGQSGAARNRFTSPAWDEKSGSTPDGYRPPYTWVISMKPGGMAARYTLLGSGSLVASGAMGKNATAALAGSGSLTATGALIVSAVAALSGSGAITTANAVGIANAVAALAGTGAISSADLRAIGRMLASLAGVGSSSALLTAIGHMEATIEIGASSELTAAQVASEVWNALAASFNAAGTMGEKMNDAGSASNPWTEVIEGSFTAAEMLRLIAAAAAGELSGAATTTITILGIDGATDRIIATVTSDGDRTALTLDGS